MSIAELLPIAWELLLQTEAFQILHFKNCLSMHLGGVPCSELYRHGCAKRNAGKDQSSYICCCRQLGVIGVHWVWAVLEGRCSCPALFMERSLASLASTGILLDLH